MSKIVPVLLAGGAGTRLWPVSRDALPKQFLPLVGERSTYQETLLRVADDKLFAPPIVITGTDFRFFARRQAEDLGIEVTVVIEPMRRDSGPALAAAAALVESRDPEAVVLALAADHVILDVDEFRATCATGAEGRAGRPHRHLRHHAERAQDQLRLYPAAAPRSAAPRCPARGGLRREAQCRDGEPLRRRRLPPGTRATSCSAPTC